MSSLISSAFYSLTHLGVGCWSLKPRLCASHEALTTGLHSSLELPPRAVWWPIFSCPRGQLPQLSPFCQPVCGGRKALVVAILLSLGELFLGVFELILLCREWGAQKNVVYLNFRLQICQVCPSLSILPLWACWVFPFLTLLLILLLLRVRDVCCFNGLLTESRTLEDVGSTNKLLS